MQQADEGRESSGTAFELTDVSSPAWTQIRTHCACSCSWTSWCCGAESTSLCSSCTGTGRCRSEQTPDSHYHLWALGVWLVCFCTAGLQKSFPAAKLLLLCCTLPFLSEPAGGWRPWRKKHTPTQSWPAAAEHAHNVSWRSVLWRRCSDINVHSPPLVFLTCADRAHCTSTCWI